MIFDEFKELIQKIDAPAQRLGIFRLQINNKGKKYDFHSLKENSGSDNLTGFGLNHYGWLNLPMPQYKKSKFHDSEDVSVNISREEFIEASVKPGLNEIQIKTKSWNGVLTW